MDWVRIMVGISAVALVSSQFVGSRRRTIADTRLRVLATVTAVLAAVVFMAPNAVGTPIARYAVFALALVYAWFRWGPRREEQ